MHTVNFIETRLTDGSKVYDVHIDDAVIPCFSERHALDLVGELEVLLAKNAVNGVRVRFPETAH